jgi:sec-independent protein translocase protein TatA
MFDVGGPELLLILLAVILLFGPKKIPEISQMLGKGVQKVRNAQSQFQEQMRDIEKEMKSSVDLDTDNPNQTPPKEITDKYEENPKTNEEIPDDGGFDEYYAKNKQTSDNSFQPKKPKHIEEGKLNEEKEDIKGVKSQ